MALITSEYPYSFKAKLKSMGVESHSEVHKIIKKLKEEIVAKPTTTTTTTSTSTAPDEDEEESEGDDMLAFAGVDKGEEVRPMSRNSGDIGRTAGKVEFS